MAGMKRIKNGFTLIELLVVVAIIGILASIVLSSLTNARKSAKDAVIKESISEALKSAEIYADKNGDYAGFCDDPEITSGGKLDSQITKNGGSFACGSTVDGFCLSSTLNLGGSICSDGYREIKRGFVCSGASDTVCD